MRKVNRSKSTPDVGRVRALAEYYENLHYEGNLVSIKNAVNYDVFGVKLITNTAGTTLWGQTFSTTAKTLIDMSSDYAGLPSDTSPIKGYFFQVALSDTAQHSAEAWLILSENSNAGSGMYSRSSGLGNSLFANHTLFVKPDANGDIYYQINATGTNTMTIYVSLFGYII